MKYPLRTTGLLVLLAAACVPFVAREPGPALLDVARAVGAAPAEVDSIWPGFALREQGFMIYAPGGSALLVTGEPAPPGFAPVADSALPLPLRGRTHQSRATPPGLEGGIDTRYRIGGILTTAYPLGATLSATLAGLYHEAFHTYQSARFAPDTVGEQVAPELLTPEYAAMVEVERRILDRALGLPAGPGLDSVLLDFLAVRRERLRGVPPRVAGVGRSLERREGSANLVGYQLAAATLGADPARVTAAVRQYLTTPLSRFGGDRAGQLLRWRAYGTGAAMGLLLDRRGEDWRGRLEAGAAFDSLIAASVDADPAPPAATAAAALARYGYAEALAGARSAAASSPAEELEAFYDLAPVRLVIEVEPRDTAGYAARTSYTFSSGLWDRLLGRRRGVSRPLPGLTLIWKTNLLHVSNPEEAGFALRVEGRPVAMDHRGGGRGMRYVVLLPRMPRVDGAVPPPGERDHPAGLLLDGTGVRFETRLPVTLSASPPDSMHVRLAPP